MHTELVVAIASAVISLLMVIVYVFQLRHLRMQNQAIITSMEASNLLRLVLDCLGTRERVRARRRTIELHREGVPLSQWTPEEQEQAEDAIRAYDFLAMMVRRGLIDEDLVLSVWGVRILDLHAATSALLTQLQADEDPSHLSNFEWLAAKARERDTGKRMAPAKLGPL